MNDVCTSYRVYATMSPLALVWPLLSLPTWTVDESRRLSGRWVGGELVGRREEIVARVEGDPPGAWRMRLEIHMPRPYGLLYVLKSPRAMLHAGAVSELRETVAHLERLSGTPAANTCQEEPKP